MQRVTAAVVLFNGTELIPGLAATLEKLPGVQVVIYDSGSTDGSFEAAKNAIPHASVISGENRGFGFGNNRCLEAVDTEYTLFLNSDADISEESLSKLCKFLDSHPDYAAAQPVISLWGWDLVTASRGVYLTPYGEAWDAGFMHLEPLVEKRETDVPAVTAAVSLWRTGVLKSIRGFDEKFFMYFEDADLSLRAQAEKWKTAVVHSAGARHMVGASSSRQAASAWEVASSVRLYRKFLGNGSLNWNWWKREIRILAGMIAKGSDPRWRLRAVSKGLSGEIEPIVLPEEVKTILYGEPADMPGRREEPGAPGPGWENGMAVPWAGLKTSGGDLVLELSAVDHSATGAVLDSSGNLLKRFVASPEKISRIVLVTEPGVVYINCDSSDSRIQVEVK